MELDLVKTFHKFLVLFVQRKGCRDGVKSKAATVNNIATSNMVYVCKRNIFLA